jgi:serine/threonine-protein kinase
MLIGVARGLPAAHRAGIVDRGLKPQNIMFFRTELGEELPKVLDFGISKFAPVLGDPEIPETRSAYQIAFSLDC